MGDDFETFYYTQLIFMNSGYVEQTKLLVPFGWYSLPLGKKPLAIKKSIIILIYTIGAEKARLLVYANIGIVPAISKFVFLFLRSLRTLLGLATDAINKPIN